MGDPSLLSYARTAPATKPWWRRSLPLWAIICWNGVGISIIGPVFLVMGIVSLFSPVDGLMMNGEPVRTVIQKWEWIAGSLGLSIAAITFVIALIRGKC